MCVEVLHILVLCWWLIHAFWINRELVKLKSCLDLPGFDKEEIIEWNRKVFKEMKNLKTLIIRNGNFSKGPKYLPNSLRVLERWKYPSHCLPSDFHPKKLTICKLPHS